MLVDEVINRPLAPTSVISSVSSISGVSELAPLPDPDCIKPPKFPLAALGEVAGSAARDIAHMVQCPEPVAVGSVLAAGALATQAHIDIRLPFGRVCPSSLYIASAVESGERKSTADELAMRPVEEFRREQARDRARLGSAGEESPPRSCTVSSATVEGIVALLKYQSSVGVFSAEGAEALAGYSMREERRAASNAFYLKFWSGETVSHLTKTSGLIELCGRRLSAHFMLQPILLGSLLTDQLAVEQGLLPRFLLARPEGLAGTRFFRETKEERLQTVERFHSRVERLLRKTPQTVEGTYELKPRTLEFSNEARGLWIAAYDEIERKQADGGEYCEMKPFASKAAEHAARVAAVVQTLEDENATTISAPCIKGALKVLDFYLEEHKRLTGHGLTPTEKHLRPMFDWLAAETKKTGAKKIERSRVLQFCPYGLRKLKAAGINPVLEELDARGYIQLAPQYLEVNPYAA